MRRLLLSVLCCLAAYGELRSIPVSPSGVEGMADPSSAAWKSITPVTLALQRTPLLYPTDPPSTADIASVEVQIARAAGKTLVRLQWDDKTRDTTALPKAERAWQGEHLVKQSDRTDRFSDACAIMIPANAADVFPSLQMGDAAHPVRIYFWDSSRGAAVMEASGRETTKRTGSTFPAQSNWSAGKWSTVLELPDLPKGSPLAVAVWNGQQQDRDGRKYFSIWYKTQ